MTIKAVEAAQSRSGRTNSHGGYILIVEDSPVQAEIIAMLLEEHGYHVKKAANGRIALATAQKESPILVISDILMQEMDGFEMTRRIRKDPALAPVPVLLLTGLAEPDDVVHALFCGADSFVIKPYANEYLLKKIGKLLEKKRPAENSISPQLPFPFSYDGKEYTIAQNREKILEFLLTTYELTMERNRDLIRAQNQVRDLNTGREEREVERARLAVIEEYSDDAILAKTLDGIITRWNSSAERIYGYSAQEMVGKSISLLVPTDHTDDTKQILERIRNGEQVIRYETLRRKKDGGLINIILTASPIRDKQNRLVGVSTIAHDVTRRKLAEEAMHASETRYRRLFETAQDGILILDADSGQIVEVNPFLITMLGFSRDQFLGKKIWEIGLFKDIVANKDNFEELQRKKYIRYEDMPLETADGQRIAVEFISNVYTVNNKKVIQCNIRDSTERKRAEEAQVASEIRYRRLFETAQDGILILDADSGQIVDANPFLSAMLGFSRDQFRGKKLWEIGLFKDIVANKDNFEELQRKEYIRYEDMPLETADGQRIAVEFISNVYTVNNKKVIQCNIRDITERKKLEEELRLKATELSRSNIELQQFAYIASHDLQEPLRAISGFTELLVKRYHGKIDEKGDTYIAFITEGTQRMQQMIQDLLTYSRVQTQSHEFVLTDSNISFDLALNDLQVAIKEHHAVVIKDTLPSIFADSQQITKMFQNLIGNALKFHKPDVIPTIHLSAHQDEKNWIFSVSDNGIGIDPQYADRIFKIFQRLHTRDEYPGTGIGLAICKRIAEQHGGTIWIDSVPGSGSTFNFTIPKRKEETDHERE